MIKMNFGLHISIVSVIVNLVLAIASLATGSSSSNIAFFIDCILDLLSSSILLWRFYDNKDHLICSTRELVACIGLGVMFIVSGIVILVKSTIDLAIITLSTPTSMESMKYLASFSFVLWGLLAAGKFFLYGRLKSRSMLLEAINTMLSSLFALAIVITTYIIEYKEYLWRLDPSMCVAFSLFMLMYGYINCHTSYNALNSYNKFNNNNNYISFRNDNIELSLSLRSDRNKKDYEIIV